MHGGLKIYSGAPAAARHYVEADRGRADDYYLAEGSGVARRFTAGEGRVVELAPLTGEAYETWVAGRDPETGEPRGQLRTDAHAVRFVEVVVNGPKTWSLAAALHADVAAAYEAAQDRAAEQILAWLSQHATSRVGPRGGQVPAPVDMLEAVTVRHYTSRGNDPHWHLHLQLSARVFAADKWRGLHVAGVCDSLAAINGIGYAAMACDPEFNSALAVHGYTKDDRGEIRQLVEYVGPMSARHAQISRNADRYESEWMAAHPGESPGPALRRAWDARAWAQGRPDKVRPRPGADIGERWRTELSLLGHHEPDRPVSLSPTAVGALDRNRLVDRALTRVAAVRSGWNAADVRGEVERLIAAAGIVTEPAVRLELAEDLTTRALGRCVPLLDRPGLPEHIRAWTSAPVLDVEADLTARLAARAAQARPAPPDTDETPPPADRTASRAGRLDPGQVAVVAALAGHRSLVVVEGAAGVGKTTTLAAARTVLEEQDRRLVVVTPTLKAAKVAAAEVGAPAGSAARLAFEYGWRWTDDGAWTRLTPGEVDPVTSRVHAGPGRLRPGDLLVVDEAGMLDQDTARALLTVADECAVRVALLGDRHQLPAVGRGGVLDLAVGQVDADAYLSLEGLHRFTRVDEAGRTVPDTAYGGLTLAMRSGTDPGAVFDRLLTGGRIRIHPDEDALRQALAGLAAAACAAGGPVAVVADTREQVAELNTAIRERLVAAGRVDDLRATVTAAGEWVGVGDRIVTRRNDPARELANRDRWIVADLAPTGALIVTPADPRIAGWSRVLPADYVARHVELGYASTAHGAQGETVTAAHLVVGESTGAASAYVGMTRGRQANTAHLVAASLEQAREQWIAVFGRDRADLGPARAARLAAAEAARYVRARPLDDVLGELHAVWTEEQRCRETVVRGQWRADGLRDTLERHAGSSHRLAALQAACARTDAVAAAARQRAQAAGAAVDGDTDRTHQALLDRWLLERQAARRAARVVLDGPGPLGLRRGAVARAHGELTGWLREWAPLLPTLTADRFRLAELAAGPDHPLDVEAGLHAAARRAAEAAHPEHAELRAAAATAQRDHDRVRDELGWARYYHDHRYGTSTQADYARQLADAARALAAARQQLTDTRARVAALHAEPAVRTAPAARIAAERAAWRARRDASAPAALAARLTPPPARTPRISARRQELGLYSRQHDRARGRGIGR